MFRKNISLSICLILLLSLVVIPIKATAISSNINGEIQSTLNDFFKSESIIKDEVYYYGERAYVQINKNESTKDTVDYLKFVLTKLDGLENNIDIAAKKYEKFEVEERYLSAAKVIVGYYKNAIYEILLFIKENNSEIRFNALDRYFYNRLTGKNTAEWLKQIAK